MNKDELRILQVGDVLVSPNIITEKFCCDLDACKGECCIEGDAGAPGVGFWASGIFVSCGKGGSHEHVSRYFF